MQPPSPPHTHRPLAVAVTLTFLEAGHRSHSLLNSHTRPRDSIRVAQGAGKGDPEAHSDGLWPLKFHPHPHRLETNITRYSK